MRPGVIAYDVNETLLDLSALDDAFEETLGDASLRPTWFATMLQVAFTGTITGRYVQFGEAQRAALRMVGRRVGRDLADDDVERVVGGMTRLPPHPEVLGALTRLRDAGLRQVLLTNSTLEVAQAQARNSGLAGVVDDVLGADEVRALKPAAAPYGLVAERCGVPIGEVMLVAAHAWDVSGALAAGARAAFIARPGMVPSPLGEQPELVVGDLAAFAEEVLG